MKTRDWIGVTAVALYMLGFEVALLVHTEWGVVPYRATYTLWALAFCFAIVAVGMTVIDAVRSMRRGSHKTPPP